ncbi:MAG: beta-lactamase family protein [Proteobacteria bacterium]|nr:beta-lactamase family protein [Pseudomonadota bacterium]
MFKKILPVVLALPFTTYATPDCKVIDKENTKNLPLDAITGFVQNIIYEQTNVPALMIGIIVDGEKAVIACGETVKGNNQLPNIDTVWPIGSVSKVFTTDILARMVNQGKVRLNSSINELLGLAPNPSNTISLLDLATHSSGFPRQLPSLPNNDDYQINIPYEMPEFLKWYQTYKPTVKPGTHYDYSNVGYGLLGQLLAKKMGTDFETLLNEQIAKPLALKDTTTKPTEEQKKRQVASYWMNGDLIKKDWEFKFEQPSGGIYSTMRDMLVFASYQAGLLNEGLDNIKLAQASYIYQGEFDNPYSFGEDAMALGWSVDYPKAELPLRLVKNGWVDGVNTYVRVFPSKKISLVSLTSKPYLNILSDLDKIAAMILEEQKQRKAHE